MTEETTSGGSSVTKTIQSINLAVTGIAPSLSEGGTNENSKGGSTSEESSLPYEQALGLSVQSVAQSAAIAVSDATDMLRNVETVMTTAMGVAMAKWIETPENVFYEQIVNAATTAISNSAKNFEKIGTDAQSVLAKFKPQS